MIGVGLDVLMILFAFAWKGESGGWVGLCGIMGIETWVEGWEGPSVCACARACVGGGHVVYF